MILVDSGKSKHQNLGDNAILSHTLKKLNPHTTKVYDADYLLRRETRTVKHFFKFLTDIIQCKTYYVCCGGLFKTGSRFYVLRKLLGIALAKLFRKNVVVDPQTVYLRGIYRILFKMIVANTQVLCRDHYSLYECKQLKLKCQFEQDVLFNPWWLQKKFRKIVGFDSRTMHNSKSNKKVYEFCNYLKKCYEQEGFRVVKVPTIQLKQNWRTVIPLFNKINDLVCSSFHAAIFGVNHAVNTVCVYQNEYYHRKFSVLKNVTKIDLRNVNTPLKEVKQWVGIQHRQTTA